MESTSPQERSDVAEARRIVVKLGTRVLTRGQDVALARLAGIVEEVTHAHRDGREVLIVSSGAVGLGRQALGLTTTPTELTERQVCAAVGQSRLMELYQSLFSRFGVITAQVLLTELDFKDRARYLNLRGALCRLLARGIVPIINENDVVATEELVIRPESGRCAGPGANGNGASATPHVFGDNDTLSALVASKLDAQLLVLLTDVPGVFDADPQTHPDAQLVSAIADVEELVAELSGTTSAVSRGGMRNKVAAAAIAARSGCHAVIASGLEPGQLGGVLAGRDVGTWFAPNGHLSARQRWIAFASTPSGVLHLDAGAVAALTERHGSLLPAGVVRAEGDFHRGDVVELKDPADRVIGRGIVETDAAQTLAWMHGQAPAGVRTLIRGQRLVLTSAHPEGHGRPHGIRQGESDA